MRRRIAANADGAAAASGSAAKIGMASAKRRNTWRNVGIGEIAVIGGIGGALALKIIMARVRHASAQPWRRQSWRHRVASGKRRGGGGAYLRLKWYRKRLWRQKYRWALPVAGVSRGINGWRWRGAMASARPKRRRCGNSLGNGVA